MQLVRKKCYGNTNRDGGTVQLVKAFLSHLHYHITTNSIDCDDETRLVFVLDGVCVRLHTYYIAHLLTYYIIIYYLLLVTCSLYLQLLNRVFSVSC